MRFEGKTVEEAKANACIKLEKTIKELEFTIIDNGSKGFLGLGAKPAIVEAKILSDIEEDDKDEKKDVIINGVAKKVEKSTLEVKSSEEIREEIAKSNVELVSNNETKKIDIKDELTEYLTNLVELLGCDTPKINIEIDEPNRNINVDIDVKNATNIIGKRGSTLDAIQTIVNSVFSRDRGYYWIKLDADNYREKRVKTIESLAYRSANTVKKYKRRVVLDRLTANERRIIHSALQNDNRIETHSEGNDRNRKLIISLKRR